MAELDTLLWITWHFSPLLECTRQFRRVLMCDCWMVLCVIVLIWHLGIEWNSSWWRTTPPCLDVEMAEGMWKLLQGVTNPRPVPRFPLAALNKWHGKNTRIYGRLIVSHGRPAPHRQGKIVTYFESWGWHLPAWGGFRTWNNEWITSALKQRKVVSSGWISPLYSFLKSSSHHLAWPG